MITPQIAIDFLTLDDDNAYLYDGTPHCPQICAGFSAHGIDCPAVGTGLWVRQEDDLVSAGVAGGPFSPAEITYTLENLNDTPLEYTVATTQRWLTLSPSAGPLDAHETADVTISINSQALDLLVGTYTGTVAFTNTTDHVGDALRSVELTVAIARYTLEASANGTDWMPLWSNGWVAVSDRQWTTQTYDLSPAIGAASTVYVRWGYQVYRPPWAYSAWNIDDIEFLGDAAGE
jgi:hypothetical protein